MSVTWSTFEPFAGHEPLSTSVPTLREIHSHRVALGAAAARHGASCIRVFGSVARGTAMPESDVDLLVALPPTYTLLQLAALYTEFQQVLGRAVDIVVEADLREPLRSAVLRDATPL